MKTWLIIGLTATGCITLIACVAMAMGHDNTIVTGAVGGITGIVAGFAGYYLGKSKASSQGQNVNTKTDSSSQA
jgi:hypothetical protein